MSAVGWAAVAVGLVLVGTALREVFHTLLHPSGVGRLTPAVFRLVWRAAQRTGGRPLTLAGPAAMVASIVLWTLLLVLGWALVYWPSMPDAFQVAPGLDRGEQGSLLDAVYASAVTLSTLGYGDIVAEATALRLAMAAEALVGFALLTASISWVLSVYPALMRRRSLAARIGTLVAADGDEARLVEGNPPATLAAVLHGLAGELATVRVDLIQFPASYFFHGPHPELSLASALPRLRRALDAGVPPEAATAAATVRAALAGVGQTLVDGPFGLRADGPDEAIAAYRRDHRR